jgi:hypothetical protein
VLFERGRLTELFLLAFALGVFATVTTIRRLPKAA